MRSASDTAIRAALYDLYLALFKAHQASPEVFHLGRVTTIHTAIMGLEDHGWRVVGITPEALDRLAEVDFDKRKLPRELCRGHLVDRRHTVQVLFDRKRPLSLPYFFRTFLKNDDTVIMLASQNPSRGHKFPHYIEFENPECGLFPNGSLMAWKHRSQERDFLRKLHEKRRVRPARRSQ